MVKIALQESILCRRAAERELQCRLTGRYPPADGVGWRQAKCHEMLSQAPICALNLEALLLTEVNYFGCEISPARILLQSQRV